MLKDLDDFITEVTRQREGIKEYREKLDTAAELFSRQHIGPAMANLANHIKDKGGQAEHEPYKGHVPSFIKGWKATYIIPPFAALTYTIGVRGTRIILNGADLGPLRQLTTDKLTDALVKRITDPCIGN
jgi:hypothetical protein